MLPVPPAVSFHHRRPDFGGEVARRFNEGQGYEKAQKYRIEKPQIFSGHAGPARLFCNPIPLLRNG